MNSASYFSFISQVPHTAVIIASSWRLGESSVILITVLSAQTILQMKKYS